MAALPGVGTPAGENRDPIDFESFWLNQIAGGIVRLGLTPEQIGEFTPRHLSALWQQYELHHQRSERYASTIALMFANKNRNRELHPEPFKLEDFLKAAVPAAPVRAQTIEEQTTMLRAFAEAVHARKGPHGR